MRKCIAYYKESKDANMSSIHMENAESSMCMYLTDDQKHLVEFADKSPSIDEPIIAPIFINQVEELIALKKTGFSASEIIELKQSKLI